MLIIRIIQVKRTDIYHLFNSFRITLYKCSKAAWTLCTIHARWNNTKVTSAFYSNNYLSQECKIITVKGYILAPLNCICYCEDTFGRQMILKWIAHTNKHPILREYFWRTNDTNKHPILVKNGCFESWHVACYPGDAE